ncbi:FadR family transcriptional regulator [Leucobacter sp. UCMA 4100]|uniref:FadR/GntR family transcriptional regulator n=1 Tax=Leucobacter sp. UCMA 4100 TaxID=2810534 RepID=UPI0022EA9BEE|nr:FCD domain-containing protein [Leucobacter sp. UCMA 4100]MDA3147000.1 FadR family transcriptional regulator [Leucobacter sp. UCMA 4100]
MDTPNWNELLQPVTSAGVSEAVMRRLGELIGSGMLKPGDRLPPEAELAQHFDVAPMTVRNALQVMRDREILRTTRGRGAGTFVQSDIREKLWYQAADFPTVSEFEDFTRWREAISGECCAIVAAQATPDELVEIKELAHAVDGEELTPDEYRFADARLHIRIAELTGSSRLITAEQQIQAYLTSSLTDEGPRTDPRRLKTQKHTHLIKAITDQKPEEARQRLKEHARATFDVMVGVGRIRQDEPGER